MNWVLGRLIQVPSSPSEHVLGAVLPQHGCAALGVHEQFGHVPATKESQKDYRNDPRNIKCLDTSPDIFLYDVIPAGNLGLDHGGGEELHGVPQSGAGACRRGGVTVWLWTGERKVVYFLPSISSSART